ncbi:MAG: COX15/CtaA family protein, partial [Burkholderiaceae bacterium]
LGSARASHWPWAMLDPWRVPVWDPQVLPIHAAGAVTQLVHRVGAGVLVLLIVLLVLLSARTGRAGTGWLLLVLLVLQLGLGVLMVATGLPLPVVLCHNLIAAAMLALVLRLI